MSRQKGRTDTLVPSRRSEIINPLDPVRQSGTFAFRYSCTEVYNEDGRLHMKRRETRYQDGRLMSEECEGMLDRQAYDGMVMQAQQFFLSQVGNLFRLFWPTPLGGSRETGEDRRAP